MGCAAAEETRKHTSTFIEFLEPVDIRFQPVPHGGEAKAPQLPSGIMVAVASRGHTPITGSRPGSKIREAPPFQALRAFDCNLKQVGRLGVTVLKKDSADEGCPKLGLTAPIDLSRKQIDTNVGTH